MPIKLLLRFLSKKNVYKTVPIYNLNWVRSKKLFRKLLGDSIITLVDVGARGGSAEQIAGSAEELMPLENHINYIGFDADEEEVKRLNYNANPNLQQYCGTLGRFFDHVNKNPSKVSRAIKFFVDKIVFILLHIRKKMICLLVQIEAGQSDK